VLKRLVLASVLTLCSAALVACGSGDNSQTAANAPATTTTTRPTAPANNIELKDTSLAAAVAADGLTMPTSIAFAGRRLLVTEKSTGKVLLVDGPGKTREVIDLAVNSFDERGLLGIAVHPDFPRKPFVYLQWTWRGDGTGPAKVLGSDSDQAADVPSLGNRVDRFRWANNKLTFDRNLIRLPSNTLNTDTSGRIRGNHDAGPLAFGPDGKLYFMLGDQNMRGQLQNITSGPAPDNAHLTGVVLRLDDDGSVPSDNPFVAAGKKMGGGAGANVQKIYTYGVRNSFGLAFEPKSGALWQTENGDDASDEVNVFTRGSNSGWIQLQGAPAQFDTWKGLELASKDGFDNPTYPPTMLAADATAARKAMASIAGSHYAPPVLTYKYPPALTAINFVRDGRLGARSADTAWIGTVLTDSLLRYPLAKNGRKLALTGALADGVDDNAAKGDLGESAPYVVGTGFGIVTDIEPGPDGALYVSSLDAGKVYRLTKASGADSGTATTAPPSSALVPAATVHIKDDVFDPTKVEIKAGEAVVWRWEGKDPHNVDGPGFKSRIQTSGSYTKAFDQPGTFEYRCDVHPTMLASVVVT
jgi:glucose/arabinose dehydrogenase